MRGREAHSALPNLGVNAIEYAAELVLYIRAMGEHFAHTETRDFGFPVPYTTLQTTIMHGGTGQNIVPKDCEFLVDVRTLPTQSFESIYDRVKAQGKLLDAQMKAKAIEAGVDFEFICSIPSFAVDEQHQLVKFHPIYNWTLDEVKDYIKQYNIPYNTLHDRGFPSIGCAPCTRAVQPGEDFRAGRWWWEDQSKKECGLHEVKQV